MKTNKGYEKLGISCYSTSRKKAAITFANKKNISLKDWLKSYNVIPNDEIVEKITNKDVYTHFINIEKDTYLCYYFDFKQDRFILNSNKIKHKLPVNRFIKYINYMEKDDYTINYVQSITTNDYKNKKAD